MEQLDVTGDGDVTPLDMLWVINGMHRGSASLRNPFDESAQDQVFSELDFDALLGPQL